MSSSDYFGPALPPGFTQSVSDTSKTDLGAESVEKDSPKHRHSSHDSSDVSNSGSSSSGSKSSENIKRSRSHSSSNADTISSPVTARPATRIIGPVIPEGIQPTAAVSAVPTEEPIADVGFIGPVIPVSLITSNVQPTAEIKEDDDDLVGPMPVADPAAREQAALEQIEQRAKLMKDKLLGNDLPDASSEIAARETWMTELPPEMKKNFGVTARTFSTKAPTSLDKDRSAWTDTPADRARKEQELREGKAPAAKVAPEVAAISAQDGTYREQVDEYNRLARPKSLLEMHSDKLHHKSHKSHHSKKRKRNESDGDEKDRKKKKKKKHGKRKHRDDHDSDSEASADSSERKKKKKKKKDKEKEKKKGAEVEPRRPFDREKDLSIVKMNDAQRKSVIQRSQELTGRFGHGGTQFL